MDNKCCYYMEVSVILQSLLFSVAAIALFVSLVINIFVVAVFAEVIKDFYPLRDSSVSAYRCIWLLHGILVHATNAKYAFSL